MPKGIPSSFDIAENKVYTDIHFRIDISRDVSVAKSVTQHEHFTDADYIYLSAED